MVIDMNLRETNNGGKQTGRRRSSRNESTQKKTKPPRRGMGVEMLERVIRAQENGDHEQSLSVASAPYTTSSSCTTLPNGGVQLRYGYPPPTPVFVFNENGSSPFGVIRFENPKEFSSIPSYVKCASDGCGVYHKKIRIHGGNNAGIMNQTRYLAGNSHGVVEMKDGGKSRNSYGQPVTEYDFWSGNGDGTGSCVTAVSGNEEGSVSGVDLSLRL